LNDLAPTHIPQLPPLPHRHPRHRNLVDYHPHLHHPPLELDYGCLIDLVCLRFLI